MIVIHVEKRPADDRVGGRIRRELGGALAEEQAADLDGAAFAAIEPVAGREVPAGKRACIDRMAAEQDGGAGRTQDAGIGNGTGRRQYRKAVALDPPEQIFAVEIKALIQGVESGTRQEIGPGRGRRSPGVVQGGGRRVPLTGQRGGRRYGSGRRRCVRRTAGLGLRTRGAFGGEESRRRITHGRRGRRRV